MTAGIVTAVTRGVVAAAVVRTTAMTCMTRMADMSARPSRGRDSGEKDREGAQGQQSAF